jgi:hypothetical protein
MADEVATRWIDGDLLRCSFCGQAQGGRRAAAGG